MTRIGIVAHFAYGAMTGGGTGHAGGVERQTSLLSRWLAARGHRVSLLTWDEGQGDDATIDGVRVIRMCRRDAGMPGLRFFHPRWTSLNRALGMADADVYYQNCAEYVTGQVALWCRRHGRRFVYSVASDPDCDPRLPALRTLRERVLYRYGLRGADRVIVQTRAQQRTLRDGFGVESIPLPMPCPGPLPGDYRAPSPPGCGPGRVLWVGRVSREKRLELLLEVAAALPGVAFEVAGPQDADEAYCRTVLDRARALPNVTVHGRVPRDRMRDLYEGAALLCCTSAYEGFPNTFLEAWSYGLPVVSTVDPDGLIVARTLGAVAETGPELVAGLGRLLQSPALWRKVSANARGYYLDNHTVESVMPRVERLLLDAVAAGTGRSAGQPTDERFRAAAER